MSKNHYVIIGNGATANAAALTLRQRDPLGRITLISDEFQLFYYRHRLPAFLIGEESEEQLTVHPSSFYKQNQIRLRLGQEVIRVDLDKKQLYLKHMEKVSYSHLLLALGGKPYIPDVHYAYRQLFSIFKTLEDARLLRSRLNEIRSVVIAGGDLVSMRLASSLRKIGRQVTMILSSDAFWPIELTDSIRSDCVRSLKSKGIEVIDDDRIFGIEQRDDVTYEVRTANDVRTCNYIGAFFGWRPQVDFLLRSGLDIDRGILVDEHLRTNFEDVFAAGDCAQVYNPEIRNYWVSIGWPNAERLGKLAASNMIGDALQADESPQSVLELDGIRTRTSWWKDYGST